LVTETELEKAKNEVLRKIGRNMLLYQQVENMLKFLIANGKISGYASELKANKEQKTAVVLKQTLGQVVGQFVEKVHPEYDESTTEQAELKEGYFSFSFKLESDAVFYKTKKDAFASIVADRNELIHHFQLRFNLQSIESCLEADLYLQQQREKLLPEIEDLKNLIETLQAGRKEFVGFLVSEEGNKQFELLWLRQSRLVILLAEISKQVVRPDGWTLLSRAGQLVSQHAPKEIAVLNERYGHKTLKGLILATELFDMMEEASKGGTQLLYRLIPGWVLQSTDQEHQSDVIGFNFKVI
jgi:hypothetical protein